MRNAEKDVGNSKACACGSDEAPAAQKSRPFGVSTYLIVFDVGGRVGLGFAGLSVSTGVGCSMI